MKKPDKKFFRFSLESIMEHRTTVLSRMGDTSITSAKHLLQYHSYHLGKPVWHTLSSKVFTVLSRLIVNLSPDACVCFDSVDLNKHSAKQMEDLKKVRDGSTGNIVNGYVLNAVSLQWIPLLMERELLKDTDGNDLTTRFEIFESQIAMMKKQFWWGYWVLADRLYDDVKKYNLLLTSGFRFAIRMKTSRFVTIKAVLSGGTGIGTRIETGIIKEQQIQINERVQVKDIPIGHYEITFSWLIRPCYLMVTLKSGMKNPLRVLSSERDKQTVMQYLKRWEIERIFKTSKQELEFEKIGTQSKHKIDHLIALVQLSLGIAAYVYNQIVSQSIVEETSYIMGVMPDGRNQSFETKEKAVVDATAFCKHMKRYLIRVSKTFNRNSILCFIGDYMKKVRKIYWNLEKVTQKPQLSAQLSLGF